MRVLFVSNLFPPYARGGYELWCDEVASTLAERGHQVCVLTSLPPADEDAADEYNTIQVQRVLNPELEGGLGQTIARLLTNRRRLESSNLEQTARVIAEFQPDVALIWGMWNIPRTVPALIEQLLPARVAYFLCDYWLSLPSAYIQRWQEPAGHRLVTPLKQRLGKIFLPRLKREDTVQLELMHPICVSRAVRDKLVADGVPVQHAQIIYGGTQISGFDKLAEHNRDAAGILKLVFLGRLEREKGLHTALEALHLCNRESGSPVTLDVYGSGEPAYEKHLGELVQRYSLNNAVRFRGTIPRTQIPDILSWYTALIFPSEWAEPFARTVLEAMAAGLVVIGTTTGGTPEILSEMQTGLTFPAGDPVALATQLDRLRRDPELGRRLATNGRKCVRHRFTFDRMVDELEQALAHIASRALNDLDRRVKLEV